MTATSRRTRGEPNVVPFDFRRPNKFSRDHVRAFQIVHETFARQLSTVLATTLRAGASCSFGKVEQLTYDEYVRSLPNPSYMVILSLNPLPGAALLQLPLDVAFCAVELLLGGKGYAEQPARPFTELGPKDLEPLRQQLGFAICASEGKGENPGMKSEGKILTVYFTDFVWQPAQQ